MQHDSTLLDILKEEKRTGIPAAFTIRHRLN